jgi:hypothetical protein
MNTSSVNYKVHDLLNKMSVTDEDFQSSIRIRLTIFNVRSQMKGEETNTNVIVFDLTWLEPMIYCTRGNHANHYTLI